MIFLFIILLYASIIGYYFIGLNKLVNASEILKTEQIKTPLTQFSIIIPFRNEAERLPGLLQTIANLDYSKIDFEVLLINDDSSDASITIIEKFKEANPAINLCILNNKRVSAAPKKDAISLAISKAQFNWIITTDADCLVPQQWLLSFHNYIVQNDTSFIAAPVSYKTSTSYIDQFQSIDTLSLQGITMGSFGQGLGLFCNGANLGYTKDVFYAVHGFENNKHIASGDDVFMLENVQRQFPLKVGYLKSPWAVVETFPEKKWSTLLSQRKRWAKKTSKQKQTTTKMVGLVVFMTNISVLLLPIYILFTKNLWLGIAALLIKIIVDFLFLYKTGLFFKTKVTISMVLAHFYTYAIISTYVAVNSLFSSYQWKGRTHRE